MKEDTFYNICRKKNEYYYETLEKHNKLQVNSKYIGSHPSSACSKRSNRSSICSVSRRGSNMSSRA